MPPPMPAPWEPQPHKGTPVFKRPVAYDPSKAEETLQKVALKHKQHQQSMLASLVGVNKWRETGAVDKQAF